MALPSRQLNRATLARQLLLERRPADVVEGVRQVVALQRSMSVLDGQARRGVPAIVQAARSENSQHRCVEVRVLVGGHSMERDAHERCLDDRPLGEGLVEVCGIEASEPVPQCNVGRCRLLRLQRLVRYTSEPRSKDEILSMLSDGSPIEPRLWWALRTYAPLIHIPTGGPWSFGRSQAFASASTTPARPGEQAALQHLIWRYLEGFGPATAQDFGQFALQRQAEIGPALEAMADRLTILEGPDGETLFDVPGGLIPSADAPAPARLLGMWDSILLAYRDRSRIIPDDYRAHVIRRNGDVLPTVLVDGYVSGVWRPTDSGIEVQAFHALSDRDWSDLAQEAGPLRKLVASRDPQTYRRYAGWWDKLPVAERRTIGQSATA